MSYELRHSETLGENLRRIHRRQIDNAIAYATGAKESDDTAVHETRKHLKRARAALRLVRKEIGRGLFRQQDTLLRDVGRMVSDVRDAEVRLSTIRQLREATHQRGKAAYRELEKMLTLELESFVAGFAEWEKEAVPLLEQARDSVDCWALGHFSFKQLRCAVQCSYKRARDLLAEAKRNSSTPCFHKFRTATKVLSHQLRILRPVNGVVLKSLNEELSAMGDLLGRAHDLSFLGERLRPENGRAEWQRQGQKLLALIEVSQGDLQRGAAEVASRFFAERPRDFGARLETWLDEWSNSSAPSVAEALLA